MKHTFRTAIITAALLVSPHVFAAEDACRVILTAGVASYRTAESDEWTALKDGMLLRGDAVIKTGPRSRVVLEKNGRQITIAESRIVSLKEVAQDSRSGAADKMSHLRSRLGDLLSGRKYVSSTTVVAVRGEKTDESSSPVWSEDPPAEKKPLPEKPMDKVRDLFSKSDYKAVAVLLEPELKNLAGAEKSDGNYMLFLSYYNMGSYAKCLEHSDHLIIDHESSPQRHATVIFITALAYNNTGAYSESIGMFSRFVSEFPDDSLVPEACFMLAGSYMLGGDEARAMKYYRLILDRFPDSPVARDAAEAVEKKKDLNQKQP